MKNYEVVYIFDSALGEERIQEKLGKFHELLTGPGQVWGLGSSSGWGWGFSRLPVTEQALRSVVSSQSRGS